MRACVKNENMLSRSIQEIIRMLDAKKLEEKHGEKKLGYEHEHIDKEARNVFNSRNITTSIIKCAHGCNHFGLRDLMISNNMIETYCPRYQMVETWDIVKCDETMQLRKEFIEKLLLQLLKNKGDIDVNEIILVCEDMLTCLENGDEDEYKMNQQFVGMQELFRGYVMSD